MTAELNPSDPVPVRHELRTRPGGYTVADMTDAEREAFGAWLDRNRERLVTTVTDRLTGREG